VSVVAYLTNNITVHKLQGTEVQAPLFVLLTSKFFDGNMRTHIRKPPLFTPFHIALCISRADARITTDEKHMTRRVEGKFQTFVRLSVVSTRPMSRS